MNKLSAHVLDYYDDPDFYTDPVAHDLIEKGELLSHDKLASLRDKHFAMVTDSPERLRRYPTHSKMATALSAHYFSGSAEYLPQDIRDRAAEHLLAKCAEYGLEKQAELVRAAKVKHVEREITLPTEKVAEFSQASLLRNFQHLSYQEKTAAATEIVRLFGAEKTHPSIWKYAEKNSVSPNIDAAIKDRLTLAKRAGLAQGMLDQFKNELATREPKELVRRIEVLDKAANLHYSYGVTLNDPSVTVYGDVPYTVKKTAAPSIPGVPDLTDDQFTHLDYLQALERALPRSNPNFGPIAEAIRQIPEEKVAEFTPDARHAMVLYFEAPNMLRKQAQEESVDAPLNDAEADNAEAARKQRVHPRTEETKAEAVKKKSRSVKLARFTGAQVKSGIPGPEHIEAALKTLGQLKATVRPDDKLLESHGLSRERFQDGIDRIYRKAGKDSYNLRSIAPNPALMAAGAGAGGAGAAALIHQLHPDGLAAPTAAALIAAPAALNYLRAKYTRNTVGRTGKVLKDYGLLNPKTFRAAYPLLTEKVAASATAHAKLAAKAKSSDNVVYDQAKLDGDMRKWKAQSKAPGAGKTVVEEDLQYNPAQAKAYTRKRLLPFLQNKETVVYTGKALKALGAADKYFSDVENYDIDRATGAQPKTRPLGRITHLVQSDIVTGRKALGLIPGRRTTYIHTPEEYAQDIPSRFYSENDENSRAALRNMVSAVYSAQRKKNFPKQHNTVEHIVHPLQKWNDLAPAKGAPSFSAYDYPAARKVLDKEHVATATGFKKALELAENKSKRPLAPNRVILQGSAVSKQDWVDEKAYRNAGIKTDRTNKLFVNSRLPMLAHHHGAASRRLSNPESLRNLSKNIGAQDTMAKKQLRNAVRGSSDVLYRLRLAGMFDTSR